MNLFKELFYDQWVTPALYPMPVEHWLFFNESLVTFPIIELSPGYPSSSRRTKKPQIIVLHHTGSLDPTKALRWFGNPNNYVSTHWLVDLDGHIQQLVSEENASLHISGGVYKHSRLVAEMSFGIHLVGNGYDRFTEAQYEATAMLCAYLQKKYGLKDEDILKHSEIETTNSTPAATDPAPWSKEKFNELLDKFKNV
jgi:N-acetyl-anhydromuramyl-L-alanine amidase AmpD